MLFHFSLPICQSLKRIQSARTRSESRVRISAALLRSTCGLAATGAMLAPAMLTTAAHGAPSDYRKIALSGETANGATSAFGSGPDGISFSNAVINNIGMASFTARLAGSQFGVNDRGVFAHSGPLAGNQNSQIARAGASAPGVDGGYQFIADPQSLLSATGLLAFDSKLAGGSVSNTNESAFFTTGPSQTPGLWAREGSGAPGIADVNFGAPNVNNTALSNFRMSASGRSSFQAALRGASVTQLNDTSIWMASSGGPTLVVREGGATGFIANVNYGQMISHVISDNVQVVLRSNLAGTGVTSLNDEGIFSVGPAGNFLIAREGTVAAGAGTAVFSGGGLGTTIGNPNVNASGRVAFRSPLANGGVTATNNSGVWIATPGAPTTLSLVQRENTAAPGLTAIQFDSFDDAIASDPVINDTGSLAMIVKLRGTGVTVDNDRAIYTGPTLNQLVGREGAAVPLASMAGVNFGIFNDGAAVSPAMNAGGSLLFKSSLSGAGVTTENDGALFGWVANGGGLFIVAREGEQIDVSNGSGPADLRTIASLDAVFGSGGQDGRARSLNDFGDVIFTAKFTDGTSGVFTAPIPAPASAVVGLLGMALVAKRRRRD